MPMKETLMQIRDDVAAIWWGFVSVLILAAFWSPVVAIPALLLFAIFGPVR